MTAPRGRRALVTGAVAAGLLAVAADTSAPPRDPLTYYVSPSGSDAAVGTSPATAWRTTDRVEAAVLLPGDQVLLRGGASFGELTLRQSGTSRARVVLASYGEGRATLAASRGACLTVNGSWVTVRKIVTHDCTWSGIAVGGDHVHIERIESSSNFAGVTIRAGADHAVVRDSYLHDNTTMRPNTPGPDDDSGAFGVLVNGDHALVTHSTFSGQAAPSADYGTDGSAIEVYGAVGTVVSYNIARDNHTFSELGGVAGTNEASDTTYRYNQVTSRQPGSKFIVLHAGGHWGTAETTRLVHNTAILSGASSEGVVCAPGCTPGVLSMTANLVYAVRLSASVTGSYAGADNLFAGGPSRCTARGESRACPDRFVADPGVDASGRFVTLLPNSPAIDAGGSGTGRWIDIAGQPVPVDGDGRGGAAPDIGAWERPAG